MPFATLGLPVCGRQGQTMILVTGATGFVGRQVVQALRAGGHPVRALVRSESRASVLPEYNVEIRQGDVLDPASLSQACDGVEAVIHLVAVVREGRGQTFQQVNYQGVRNTLEAAVSAGVDRFILASTIGATSDSSYAYLYSRWMAEQEVLRGPVPATVVRFSVGFGEGDEVFNVLAAQVKASPLVPVPGDGQAKFQPIAVEDVAKCLVAAYETEASVGKTIEAGGPDHLTYDDMVDLVTETLGARTVKVHVPMWLVKPAAAVMEALMPRPPATREQLKMLNLDSTTEIDLVEAAFGFKPRSIRGNLGYISRIGLGDALKMNFGYMPPHIRDH